MAEKEIFTTLTESKYGTIILDSITNNSNKSKLYFIMINENYQRIPIRVIDREGVKDAQYYSDIIKECLIKIPHNTLITSICTDGEPALSNGRNIFCKDKPIMSIRCGVHLINLLLKDIFSTQIKESLSPIFTLCIKIISYYHQSPKMAEDIKILNVHGNKIKTLSDTRFNYFLDAIKSIIPLKDILMYFANTSSCNWCKEIVTIVKSEGFWNSLNIVLIIIKPFEDVENLLQRNDIYCSDFFFFMLRVYFHVLNLNIEPEIKDYMLSRVISRMQEVLSIEYCLYVFIYYIDNRYKGLLLNDLWKTVAKTSLFHLCWRLGVEKEAAKNIKDLF